MKQIDKFKCDTLRYCCMSAGLNTWTYLLTLYKRFQSTGTVRVIYYYYYYIMKSYTRYSNIVKYKNLKKEKNINTMRYTNWTQQCLSRSR